MKTIGNLLITQKKKFGMIKNGTIIVDYPSIINPYKTNVNVDEINDFTTNLRKKYKIKTKLK